MTIHGKAKAPSAGLYRFTLNEDGSGILPVADLPTEEGEGKVLIDEGMLLEQFTTQTQRRVGPLVKILAQASTIKRRYGIDPDWSVNAIVLHMNLQITGLKERRLFESLLQDCVTKDDVILHAVDTIIRLRAR